MSVEYLLIFVSPKLRPHIELYHEPPVTKGQPVTDPTLPRHKDGLEPNPVALNFRSGGGPPLQMRLYDQQSFDVGFLRIFLSTRYLGGGLSSIMQKPPLEYKAGSWRGKTRKDNLRGTFAEEEQRDLNMPDIWDVITIPLVQRTSVICR